NLIKKKLLAQKYGDMLGKIVAYVASWVDKKEEKHPVYGFTP
ncbi:4425_t:CDS:1, partial [Funneliformis mosseae]